MTTETRNAYNLLTSTLDACYSILRNNILRHGPLVDMQNWNGKYGNECRSCGDAAYAIDYLDTTPVEMQVLAAAVYGNDIHVYLAPVGSNAHISYWPDTENDDFDRYAAGDCPGYWSALKGGTVSYPFTLAYITEVIDEYLDLEGPQVDGMKLLEEDAAQVREQSNS